MAKRSQRRPTRHLDRAQAGCIWGLISMFDFRHGRSTRLLFSDRKHAVGSGCSNAQKAMLGWTEKCEHMPDSDEIKIVMADPDKTSMKDLMEVEMFNEQRSRDQPTDSEQISSKSSNNAKDDHDLERIMEELSKIIRADIENSANTDVCGDFDAVTVEKKLAAAMKLVIEEKMSKSKRLGREENAIRPKDFMDVLQELRLNKGVFLKLLKDPNSALVKHIRNYEGAQVHKDHICSSSPGSNVLEEKLVNSGSGESSSRRHRSFFHRRSKSLDCYSLGGDRHSQSPNVAQKPGLRGSQSPDIPLSNSSLQSHNNDKNSSPFSFTEIKRKLKHAIGKERPGVSPDRMILKLPPRHQSSVNSDKRVAGEALCWSSPNRTHFFSERFHFHSERFNISSPKSEHIGKVKEKDSLLANGTSQHLRSGESNIYIEAKKRLSEMLERVDENAEPMAARLPKSLGRILSFEEYKFSPCSSPRKYDDGTTQMRLSLHGKATPNEHEPFHENHSNHPSPRRQNLDSQSCISGIISEENVQPHEMNVDSPVRDDLACLTEVQSLTQCATVPQAAETEEVMEPKSQQGETIVDISSESCWTSLGGDSEKGGSRGVENEGIASEIFQDSSTCSKSDLCEEDEILSSSTVSPSRTSVSLEIKDPVHENGKEQPSPISILEPMFIDDDVSPASSTSQPVEKEIQPRRIDFEEQPSSNEQEICMGISLEGEESAFEYVEAVLLGSGLNWDDFLMRWLSLDEILESSLFDEVELFSSQPRYDQKLLFDCANESLKEVCNNYFGCFTGASQGKSSIRAIPSGMDLINEVWKGVGHHHSPQHHSLDQLVRVDLEKSTKWMDLRSHIELTGVDMEESIFSDFVDDFVTSFVNDISALDFAVPQHVPDATEASSSCTRCSGDH